ncbi:DUF4037 domain-containing protein [Thermasporomyces composti]|uniref:Uncharacterized protein DUF4037 n=1 Tax=Thermasporomyces composti TaxID=696763 RepID=A0A3D9VBG1_THECX|nr:DUF4037 domain-containing protein [Thermasporomyces composti]REF38043.1 uncharacterized protein DUF4037 [Thermasporomyces composti]
MAPTFVPSLQLNGAFYREVVAPLVAAWPHAAALLGWGSDVLGYDTERSTDHGWGPRLLVFVEPPHVEAVRRAVDQGLPESFRGWPVRYGWDDEPVRHHVEVLPLGEWLVDQLGVDPRAGLATVDWLVIPQQKLLGVVRGSVYADPTGELEAVRRRLAWYPRDVWLWMLASQWRWISQEEAFVGRAAEVGDELGSRLITGRLVRALMRLVFLLERRYWPYEKWFGTAFAELEAATTLTEPLAQAVGAPDIASREDALVRAYEAVAARHNTLGLTEWVDPTPRRFHNRPYRVLMADRFAEACVAAIRDPTLRDLPLVGSVDQFVDSTDVLAMVRRSGHLRAFYDALRRSPS